MHILLTKRTLLWIVLCLLVGLAPVNAQETPYPTLDALQESVIPDRDRVALAQRLLDVTEVKPPPENLPARQEGERQLFWVLDSDGGEAFQVEAVLRTVGEHIYFWVETGAAIDQAQLDSLARTFDTVIYPRTRALWGSEASPGIDGDPRVYGLFASGLGATAAAYYASDHSFPEEVVPFSNEHEMLFFNNDNLLFYDVGGAYVAEVVAHEFQHMIRANLDDNEDSWMNEGFSEFTALHMAFSDFYGFAYEFLSYPEIQLTDWSENGGGAESYGAAFLFVTYFYDRYGDGALAALSEEPANGLLAVDRVLSAMGEPDVNEFFADWVMANAFMQSGVGDGRYGYRSVENLPPASSVTVNAYPYQISESASQYSAEYYELTDLGGTSAVQVTIDVPETVRLIEPDAHSGSWMWYSNKGDSSNTRLTRLFDLSTVSTATLNYAIWYDLEDLWDYAYLTVSADGGTTWDIIPTPYTTSENPNGTSYGQGYSGRSEQWIEESVSLDAYVGQTILVRFEMITDDATTQPGLVIDDVSIPEIRYSTDFETNDLSWESEGWVRINNVLPQQVWVQFAAYQGDEITNQRRLAQGENVWKFDVNGVDSALLAISPFAPVTVESAPYTLEIKRLP